jgi:quercetin dioxygenase-like cupin family protein
MKVVCTPIARFAFLFVFFVGVAVAPVIAQTPAPPTLTIKTLASTKIAAVPAGPLFWRLETFPTLALAQSAAGQSSLAVQSGGRNWLITLGPAGGATSGGTKVAEVGPIPGVTAAHYLLQVNEASGPPGAITPQHSHPGSETFYVLSGETTSRTPDGTMHVPAGRAEIGHVAGTPMQVSSSGTTDLLSLVMFLVDADQPFSTPAKLP